MDGLLEAKSEPKWKFLLRAVHAARVSKLWSVHWGGGRTHVDALLAQNMCSLPHWATPSVETNNKGFGKLIFV